MEIVHYTPYRYGDIYIVKASRLSKIAAKALRTSMFEITDKGLKVYNDKHSDTDYGIVRIIERLPFNKAKVEVFHFDIPFATAPINSICYDVVETSDIELLDWDKVKSLYYSGKHNNIIFRYMDYLGIFSSSCTNWGGFGDDNQYMICRPGDQFEKEKALMLYDTSEEVDVEGSKWMIEQVDSGKVNIEQVISELRNKTK